MEPEAEAAGRDEEVGELLLLIKTRRRVAVWGPPGVGKTALVKAVYDRLREEGWHAWATVSDPFNPVDLSNVILSALKEQWKHPAGNEVVTAATSQSQLRFRTNGDPVVRCRAMLSLLPGGILVVIDGLRCEEEWDRIKANIATVMRPECCVVVITAEERVATYCAEASDGAVYRVKGLEACAALRLFHEKAKIKNEGNISVDVWPLLSKCAGLPKFIVTLADGLAWDNLTLADGQLENLRIMHQLKDGAQNFDYIEQLFAWLQSNFDASPQLLKKCIFYLSIFPRDSCIRRKRLVRRWVAEGYSRGTSSHSLKEPEKLVDKLVDLGVVSSGKTSSCQLQVNSLFLEYIISRQAEEKIFLPLEVYILDGRSSLSTERVRQHLAVGSTWERDEFVYRSLDFSRLRSLTVSGEWKSFFVSDKMRVLRVLDLEDNLSAQNDHLEDIVKLVPRLKLLSLRACTGISKLPDSLGADLMQLETLDIRHTKIVVLPKSIIKLRKLKCIRAGTSRWDCGGKEEPSTLTRTSRCPSVSCSPELPLASYLTVGLLCSRLCKRRLVGTHDGAIEVPEGIAKLTDLHTLGVINVNTIGGMPIFNELWCLTQLRKLSVSGLNDRNSFMFLSTIKHLSHLESLSVKMEGMPRGMELLPPNLMKLSLHLSGSLRPDTIFKSVKLDKLHTLRLRVSNVEEEGGELRLSPVMTDDGLMMGGQFPEIKVLEIACSSGLHMNFAQGAMQKLERLKVHCCSGSPLDLSRIAALPALKQVCLKGSNGSEDTLDRSVEFQLGEVSKKHALKIEERCSSYGCDHASTSATN